MSRGNSIGDTDGELGLGLDHQHRGSGPIYGDRHDPLSDPRRSPLPASSWPRFTDPILASTPPRFSATSNGADGRTLKTGKIIADEYQRRVGHGLPRVQHVGDVLDSDHQFNRVAVINRLVLHGLKHHLG